MADSCCHAFAHDDTLVYIGLDTLLRLPPFVLEAIADVPVKFSNFGYEIVAPLFSSLLFTGRRTRIIAVTSGYRKSSSRIGDYRLISLDDPNIHCSRIVVPLSVWKYVLSLCGRCL